MALLLSFGCGNSNETFNTVGQVNNGNPNPTTPSSVNMSFSFNGAAAREVRQRLAGSLDLPSNTDSVVVTILNASTRATVAGPQTFERNGQATLDVEIADVPAGEVIVVVQALDLNDAVLVIGEGTGTVVDGVDVNLTIATLFSDIVVSPNPVYVAPGESVQVTVTATSVSGGNGQTVTSLATFSGSDAAVATVSDTGQVSAPNNSAGNTTFTVDFNGLTATVPVTNPQTLVVPTLNSILFYREDADGAANPVAELAGNNTTLSGVKDVFVEGQELFVLDANLSAVLAFDSNVDGNVAPTRSISGNNTGLFNGVPTSIAVANGEIFVADEIQSSILVFQATADGNQPPTRQLVGANTTLMGPGSIWVEGNELFVADGNRILVFSRTADGDQAPLRTIEGALTNLSFGSDITIRGNEIFVASQFQILVFPTTATGNVAPSRVISGSNTGIGALNGIAVNAIGEIYGANSRAGEVNPFRDVRTFAPDVAGNVAANRVFPGEGVLPSLGGGFFVNGLFLYQR